LVQETREERLIRKERNELTLTELIEKLRVKIKEENQELSEAQVDEMITTKARESLADGNFLVFPEQSSVHRRKSRAPRVETKVVSEEDNEEFLEEEDHEMSSEGLAPKRNQRGNRNMTRYNDDEADIFDDSDDFDGVDDDGPLDVHTEALQKHQREEREHWQAHVDKIRNELFPPPPPPAPAVPQIPEADLPNEFDLYRIFAAAMHDYRPSKDMIEGVVDSEKFIGDEEFELEQINVPPQHRTDAPVPAVRDVDFRLSTEKTLFEMGITDPSKKHSILHSYGYVVAAYKLRQAYAQRKQKEHFEKTGVMVSERVFMPQRHCVADTVYDPELEPHMAAAEERRKRQQATFFHLQKGEKPPAETTIPYNLRPVDILDETAMKKDILRERFGFTEDEMTRLFDKLMKDLELRESLGLSLPDFPVNIFKRKPEEVIKYDPEDDLLGDNFLDDALDEFQLKLEDMPGKSRGIEDDDFEDEDNDDYREHRFKKQLDEPEPPSAAHGFGGDIFVSDPKNDGWLLPASHLKIFSTSKEEEMNRFNPSVVTFHDLANAELERPRRKHSKLINADDALLV